MYAVKERVLLVDDEPQILVALQDLLGDEYMVLTSESPAHALQMVRDDPRIAVVISDQRMPQMNGDELLSKIGNSSRALRIMVSGFADLPSVLRAVNEGKVYAYVTKPWNEQDLLRKVHAAAQQFRMTEERAALIEALRASEALLQQRTDVLNSILDGMADGVVVTELNGDTVLMNEQARRVLGAGDHLVHAEDWPETYGLFSSDGKGPLSLTENPVVRAMRGEPLVQAEVYVENAVVAGARVTVTATPLRRRGGAITGAITLLHDVTRQRALEQQLVQSQRMEAIGRLAAGVAHDFNNLLTVIVGCGELTLDDLGEGDTRRGNVAEILAAAKHASLLTRQLLAFGRQEIIQPRELQLNDVLLGVESTLRRFAGPQIRLSLELRPELCNISGDQSQIEQIILNLVVNARDAMPDGGEIRIETAEISLSPASAAEVGLSGERYVVLTVTDNGTGMTEATRKRIFEPFFTTKEVGRGTGLGLSTVYGIVGQSAGHIHVQSVLGKGSEFKVLLPRADRSDARPSSLPPAPKGPFVARVLAVEGDIGARKIAQHDRSHRPNAAWRGLAHAS